LSFKYGGSMLEAIIDNLAALDQLGSVAHRGQRIAQLVAQHGQVFVLATVGFTKPLFTFPQFVLHPNLIGNIAEDMSRSHGPTLWITNGIETQVVDAALQLAGAEVGLNAERFTI